jgi:hypothetical protein
MSERYFGRAADIFGMVAYWTVMYGRLPDRNTLAELYTQASGTMLVEPGRPQLELIVGSGGEPEDKQVEQEQSIDEAAA